MPYKCYVYTDEKRSSLHQLGTDMGLKKVYQYNIQSSEDFGQKKAIKI